MHLSTFKLQIDLPRQHQLTIATMRVASLITLVALPLLALAAEKAPSARFKKWNTKMQSASPVKLDDSNYQDFVDAPRDYAAAVLLTALPAQFGCQMCKDFNPEWEILAKSWPKGDKKGNSRVIFGTLDFPDGKATFQRVRLERLHCVKVT
jgi:oligosaccharyltransferase complex subunit gamma